MTKDPADMNAEELSMWKAEKYALVKDQLFAVCQPLVYGENGKFFAEFPDGTIKSL